MQRQGCRFHYKMTMSDSKTKMFHYEIRVSVLIVRWECRPDSNYSYAVACMLCARDFCEYNWCACRANSHSECHVIDCRLFTCCVMTTDVRLLAHIRKQLTIELSFLHLSSDDYWHATAGSYPRATDYWIVVIVDCLSTCCVMTTDMRLLSHVQRLWTVWWWLPTATQLV